MATYYWSGECLEEAAIISLSLSMPLPWVSNQTYYLNNVSGSIYHPDANYFLLRSFTLLNTSGDGLYVIKNTTYKIEPCTPVDPPALSSTAALAIPAVALIVFWLGRIAGKQR